ncbi:DUF4058 family protein [Gemmata sp. JC673]|uniref:DUF4058 family protein n=1 Tax=Gemmata algarum TaxID=2975278 RepID=A0ABU5F1J0_9BACT|nr:DUF4058 family protein [Gemmata algarum]MDY3559796.1 DUF4058 family protein [Gemmata algarum]
MPLFDHFHGPLGRRPWESFHGQWAGAIAADLNRRLPKQFVADAPMHLGLAMSADVAEYERSDENGSGDAESASGIGTAVAVMAETYAPPATKLSMPASFPVEVKVEVRDANANYNLLAVVELVSPSNKKEESEREQFAAKCLSYLGRGVGLVVIDIVTSRHWNLHNELVRIAKHDDKFLMPDDPWTYVTAYRPVSRKKKDLIDLWPWPLKVGEPLPAVPLALKSYGCVKLELEATYAEACARLRIPE